MGHERGIVTGLSSDLKLLKLHERHEIFQISHGRQWRAALPETEEGHNRRNGPLLHSFLPGRILWPPLQGDEAQAEAQMEWPDRALECGMQNSKKEQPVQTRQSRSILRSLPESWADYRAAYI